jgi:hypothetical protein
MLRNSSAGPMSLILNFSPNERLTWDITAMSAEAMRISSTNTAGSTKSKRYYEILQVFIPVPWRSKHSRHCGLKGCSSQDVVIFCMEMKFTPHRAHRSVPTHHRTPDGQSWCSRLAMDVSEGQKQTRCIDSPVRRQGGAE